MSAREPTEEELRVAYEEQIKQIRVEDILMENVVTLVNLGMRRTGLMQGTESERDREQVRVAVEGVRALLPLIESIAPQQAGPLRQALSQLQLAYVQIGGPQSPEPSAEAFGSGPGAGAVRPETGGAPGPSGPGGGPGTPPTEPANPQSPASKPGEAGPAQRSGRLWIPGQ
jgi:hypothetical protein